MAKKFLQGVYKPQNPEKYIGNSPPVFRSSWEKRFFETMDTNPNILAWASEPLKIPYKHPLTHNVHNYIPDLLIKYRDADGNIKVELIEIKPLSQTLEEYSSSKYDKIKTAINKAKWEYAKQFCKQNNITFRILTEAEIFGPQAVKNKKARKKLIGTTHSPTRRTRRTTSSRITKRRKK